MLVIVQWQLEDLQKCHATYAGCAHTAIACWLLRGWSSWSLDELKRLLGRSFTSFRHLAEACNVFN